MPYFNIVATTNDSTVVTAYEPAERRAEAYQSEAELEKEFIQLLTQQGYTYLKIHQEADLIANLRERIEELNDYHFTDKEWERFFATELANPNAHIAEKSKIIQESPIFSFKRDDGTTKNIRIIDKKNIHNNRLQVLNQYENGKQQGAK